MYKIIDDQEDFLIVSKNQGVNVHTEDQQRGLVAQVQHDLQSEKVYLVHRLDKVTSGLLILAKNQLAASELSQLFQNRQVDKYYLAISDKKPKKKQGLVIGDMERGRRGAWKLSHTKKNPAITQFYSYGANVVDYNANDVKQLNSSPNKRLFLLKPHTGKTHQLRVALKSLGSAIIADNLYGGLKYNGEDSDEGTEEREGIFLHAYVLRFTFQGKEYCYTDEPVLWNRFLGNKVTDIVPKIKQPWELPWPFYKPK